ncbi:MAG: MBL fold metallo-hydrolase [Candidatus Schekmanbacteria bacterium]|nr:MBL fold metallo-hydrolase [Candidatus Schekmanbacteria bacterium]
MIFEQFYLGCLAHASYLLGDGGEAAVVDPQRDVDKYIDAAARAGLRIRYVIETHLHADFVSGHRELAARTGAAIVLGHRSGATFPHAAVQEGDELRLGDVALRVIETPGHTPESISLLVLDPEIPGRPRLVLTGDTLFIGDVGRPDLAGSRGHSAAEMAGMLHDSLHGKLLALDDAVEVYPAHGAGSMCGRQISSETRSTIGQQRRGNYALQVTNREDFVRLMTTDLPDAPPYFARDAEINRAGAPALIELGRPEPLPPRTFRERLAAGDLALDVRPAADFGAGHVPRALNIGLSGQLASWAGSLIPFDTCILLVTDNEDQVDEARTRLARVGHERVQGYLEGGVYGWTLAGLEAAVIEQWTVGELRARLPEIEALQLVDVRRPGEWRSGHVPGARNLPLAALETERGCLDPGRPTAVLCASGYRSSAATSLLERHGFRRVVNVTGGTNAWRAAGLPLACDEA